MKQLFLILFVLISFFVTSCNKENSSEPQINSNIDSKLQSVWYCSDDKEGINIQSDGKIILLEVDSEGLLVESSDQSTAPEFAKALDGTFTLLQPQGNLIDTLEGDYEFNGESFVMTVRTKNSTELTIPVTHSYEKSSINSLVDLKNYLSAKVDGTSINFDYVTISYSNQQLILSGSVSFQGSISIRCNLSGPGSYDLNGQNKAVFKNDSGDSFSTSQNYTGTLVIKIYDSIKKYISGTFNFEGENNGIIVTVTEGKFGGIY